jgi:hypothetical protein
MADTTKLADQQPKTQSKQIDLLFVYKTLLGASVRSRPLQDGQVDEMQTQSATPKSDAQPVANEVSTLAKR